jgi:hypothetical protein
MNSHNNNAAAAHGKLLNAIMNSKYDVIAQALAEETDIYFSHEKVDDLFSYASFDTTNHILILLNRFLAQYLSDKVKSQEWDKLVICYTGLGRYHAKFKENSLAKTKFEYALFYLQKLITPQVPDAQLASQKLMINRELANCCIENLKNSNALSFPFTTEMTRLHKKKYALQQLLAVLDDIVYNCYAVQDQAQLDNYLLTYVSTNHELAVSYIDKAVFELSKIDGNYSDEDEPEIEDDVAAQKFETYKNSFAAYRYAYIYNNQALDALEFLDTGAVELIATKEKIHETARLIENSAAAISKQDLSQLSFMSPSYQLNMICNISSNRNSMISDIHEFFNSNSDIDLNAFDDFEKVNHLSATSQSLKPADLTLIEHVLVSGNFSIFQYMVEQKKVLFSLFPTNKRVGLVSLVNEFTSPAILEYLFNPELHCYLDQPDLVQFEFFLDIMAGRLDKVKEHLEFEPESFFLTPRSHLPNETAAKCFALDLAFQFNQIHVIDYLENFIIDYAADCTRIEDPSDLKNIFRNLSVCYQRFGWNSKRFDALDIIAETYINIYLQKIKNLQKINVSDFSPTNARDYLNFQFNILEAVFYRIKLLENIADRDMANSHNKYKQLNSLLLISMAHLNSLKGFMKYVDNGWYRSKQIVKASESIKIKFFQSVSSITFTPQSQSSKLDDNDIPSPPLQREPIFSVSSTNLFNRAQVAQTRQPQTELTHFLSTALTHRFGSPSGD